MRERASALRVIALAALAVATWGLAKYGNAMPRVLPADAPLTQFSAMRADATLARLLGPETPHPASTAQNAAVRERLKTEFVKMGAPVLSYTGMGCNTEKRVAVIACATVTDIIAGVRGGEGEALLLLAHYDSVPAGPGAADDESGVATVLETARALRARGGARHHPVFAVLTDGEEYGLLGAASYLDLDGMKERAGAAINVEARGNRGQSRLFQTSPGAARLIDLYAANVPTYATSSLYAEIYKYMPNDTDLTLFIRDGIPSVNFAFADNVAHYHTPLDRRSNLSLATLQQQGDNMLGMAAALRQADFTTLKGHDDVYVDILGRWLPRIPASWALPGAAAILLLLIGAVAVSQGDSVEIDEALRAALIFPALLTGAGLSGWALSFIAQLVSGMPDPSYAHPVALRISFALGVAAVTLAVSGFAGVRAAAGAVWLWLSVLGVAVAAFLPGFSPYFLLPLAFGVVLMLATARIGWNSGAGQVALLVSAFAALLLWLGLTASGETLMGLKLHPLFTIPAAIGVSTLVPLLAARPLRRQTRRLTAGRCFAAAVAVAVIAGLLPSYSEIAPQRLNLNYVVDTATGAAKWAADGAAPLPAGLRAAANFSDVPQTPYPSSRQMAYLAPAQRVRPMLPRAAVLGNVRAGDVRRVTLGLQGSGKAAMMSVVVPGTAKLKSVMLGKKLVVIPDVWAKQDHVTIVCMSADCATMPVTLDMADNGPLKITVIERQAGLPSFGTRLLAARPKTAVPSQFGDGAMLVTPLTVPGL